MAYKVSGNIRVTLESPEGNAVLVFKKPKLNQLLHDQNKLNNELNEADKVRHVFHDRLSHLISVEDFEDEEGKITIERIKNLDLPVDVMAAIIEGYNLALGFTGKTPDPEKKDSPPV